MSVISGNVRIWMWRTGRHYGKEGTTKVRLILLAHIVLRLFGSKALEARAEKIEEHLPWGNPPMTQDAWLEECRRADIKRLHERRVAPVSIDDLMAQRAEEELWSARYAEAMERAEAARARST